MTRISRAISIRQPFAELILRGHKFYEYRSTPTKLRERVYIYASLKPKDYKAGWKKLRKEPGQLPVGVIVCSVEIIDCNINANGYAYRLAAPKRLAKTLKPINQPQPKFWFPRFK